MPAISLQGGVLAIIAPDGGEHGVSVSAAPGAIVGTLDGASAAFPVAAVQSLFLAGGSGDDVIQNVTNLPAVLLGGRGRDTLFTGTGSDFADPGPGRDVVYSLLGSPVISTAGNGRDLVFSNPNNSVDAGPEDDVVTFFAPGRTPGAGTVTLENGVLYIAPTNAGTTTTLSYDGGNVVVSTDFAGTFTYRRSDVRLVAYFGGTGDDRFVNDTQIIGAAYGSAGNDVLVGGYGPYFLLKGSSGNDVLVGRARRNDLSGNAGNDVLIALAGQGDNIFRIDPGTADLVFGAVAGDLFVSP